MTGIKYLQQLVNSQSTNNPDHEMNERSIIYNEHATRPIQAYIRTDPCSIRTGDLINFLYHGGDRYVIAVQPGSASVITEIIRCRAHTVQLISSLSISDRLEIGTGSVH